MSLPASEHPTLVHPTDYAETGRHAFAHAVRLALRGRYALSLLNIASGELGRRHSGVRETMDLLARWNMAPTGAVDAANLERDLGISVVAVAIPANDVRGSVIDYLESHRCDLAVIATRQHRGLSRWLERSLAERATRRAQTLALLMRENARGFVDAETGAMRLQRILVSAEDGVDLTLALQRIDDFVDLLGFPVDICLLHVGSASDDLVLPQDGRKRHIIFREGPVADTILETARRISADVIAMPTNKKSGVVAALRGSVTAEILDDGRWPVLSVPAA
jgi:nucleotide-binding universal stress UspA family protein